MACSDGTRRRRSGFTNPYRISSMPGTTHWVIWFGACRHYQSLPPRTCKRLGSFGSVYQRLPVCRSGSDPAEYMLYQPLPPRTGTGHRLTSSRPPAPGGWVVQGYVGLERSHSVAHSGEPSAPSGVVARWCGSVSRRKSF
jgi:hypothetical protein